MACDISYEAISRDLIEMAVVHIRKGIGVFMVARNVEHQTYLERELRNEHGVDNIFLIGKGKSISLTPNDPDPVPQVVITTITHSEGYTLTKYYIMITGVYFSNNATRYQLEARLNRIGQINNIRIIICHAGIISYIHNRYEKVRNMSKILKGFAKEVGFDPRDVNY